MAGEILLLVHFRLQVDILIASGFLFVNANTPIVGVHTLAVPALCAKMKPCYC